MRGFFFRLLVRLCRRTYVLLNACVPLRELRTLFFDGATVDTYDGNSIAFRTVVQLDGDVFTMIAPSGDTEALWSAHSAKVTKFLEHLSDQINGVVRVLTWPLSIAIFCVLALCWRPDLSFSVWGFDEWLHLFVINVLVPTGFAFLGRIPHLRSAVGKAFLRTIPVWRGLQSRHGHIEAFEQAAGKQR